MEQENKKGLGETLVKIYENLDKYVGILASIIAALTFAKGNRWVSYGFVMIGYSLIATFLWRVVTQRSLVRSIIVTPSPLPESQDFDYTKPQRVVGGIALVLLTFLSIGWVGINAWKDINRPATPTALRIDRFRVSSVPFISTELDGQRLDVIPTDCWEITNEDGTFHSHQYPGDSGWGEISFILISSKSVLIKDISIVLDDSCVPPVQSNVTEVSIRQTAGGGGGLVSCMELEGLMIGPSFNEGSLVGEEAYRFEGEYALRFAAELAFAEPGQYEFHVEIEAQTLDGEDISLISTPLSYAWLFLDDLMTAEAFDGSTGDTLDIERCP